MAHTSGLRGFKNRIFTRMSRMDWNGRGTIHTHVSTGPDDSWGVPADQIDVVPSGTYGLQYLAKHLRNNTKRLHTPQTGLTAGALLVFLGGATPPRLPKQQIPGLMEDIDKIGHSNRFSVIIVPGPHDQELVNSFKKPSIYGTDGYLDWGITYGDYRMIGVSADVSCFWNRDNESATVIIPANPTMGGFLKAKTVMRKADVLISHWKPYEMIEDQLDKYDSEAIEGAKLVSEACKIWDPELHIYPGAHHSGLLYSDGDKRAIGLRRRDGSHVVRLSRGDLRKGPVPSPLGFGEYLNEYYYRRTQGE